MRDKVICGYVVMTDQWFDFDPPGTSRGYTIYTKLPDGSFDGSFDGSYPIIFDPQLRQHWEKAIKPMYLTNSITTMFDVYDIKENKRRIHPYQIAYSEWVTVELPSYLMQLQHLKYKPTSYPPVLILKSTDTKLIAGYWKSSGGVSVNEYTRASINIIHTNEFYTYLTRLQRWTKHMIQRKKRI